MITVKQLTKSFQTDGQEILAVDQISFRVLPGEVYGLLGPNGAGKTTTLRMILGLLPADSGYAEVEGFRTTVHSNEVKARIGFVSANTGLYQWLSVRELLHFFADLYGVPQAEVGDRIERLDELFSIGQFLNQRCSTLSTGQRQRVTLARALIHDPPVMLLDEPTLGLDVVGSQVVFEYIQHVREIGKAIIVCTHRLEQAERICTRFGLMHLGRLAYEGTLDEVREKTKCHSLVDIFLGLIERDEKTLGESTTAGDQFNMATDHIEPDSPEASGHD
ncbi:MAG TPA: ATP-binding cassette domain-containing protein [Planctomycetes bacterium]|nr:ATP-binding cassette domain-containing protein [Planctomycetaceae bacterium]HIM31000.1 ATP-binding cassette domain-containing protein [Planctomycetota bacterium]